MDASDEEQRLIHVERQRGKKIGKLVPAMRRRGITSGVAESWTDNQWAELARKCGVNMPSSTTRRRIIRILMTEIELDRIAS